MPSSVDVAGVVTAIHGSFGRRVPARGRRDLIEQHGAIYPKRSFLITGGLVGVLGVPLPGRDEYRALGGGARCHRGAGDPALTIGPTFDDRFDASGRLGKACLVDRQNCCPPILLCRRAKARSVKARLYVDEIHFAYRDEASLRNDAMLVRDLILACQSLNDRFAEEGIDIVIISSIRSEFLEHPIIATADVNHAVESVGHRLSWELAIHDRQVPIYLRGWVS
jgi:hypothetical protein